MSPEPLVKSESTYSTNLWKCLESKDSMGCIHMFYVLSGQMAKVTFS